MVFLTLWLELAYRLYGLALPDLMARAVHDWLTELLSLACRTYPLMATRS